MALLAGIATAEHAHKHHATSLHFVSGQADGAMDGADRDITVNSEPTEIFTTLQQVRCRRQDVVEDALLAGDGTAHIIISNNIITTEDASSSTADPAVPLRVFGIATLCIQALLVVASSVYAWRAQNSQAIHPVAILQMWAINFCWVLAIPQHPQNACLYRTAILLFILFLNPYFVDLDNPQVEAYVCFYRFFGGVFCGLLILVNLEVAAKCFQQQQENRLLQAERKDRSNELVGDDYFMRLTIHLLGTSLKALLVLIYLFADGMSEIVAQGTREDINNALEVLRLVAQEEEEGMNNNTANIISFEERSLAEEIIIERRVEALKVTLAGSTLNIALFVSVVLSHLAHLTLPDIIHLRTTISEGVLLLAFAMGTASALAYLGFVSSVHPIGDDYNRTSDVLFALTGACFLIACVTSVAISYIIWKGKHSYLNSRIQDKQKWNHKQHGGIEGFSVMDNEV